MQVGAVAMKRHALKIGCSQRKITTTIVIGNVAFFTTLKMLEKNV